MLEKILERLRSEFGLTFAPASEEALDKLKAAFEEIELPELPMDYKGFLKTSDGVCWDGIEFYGAESHAAEDSDYVLEDIIEANDPYLDEDALADQLVIGKDDMSLFVWDGEDKVFKILDRSGFDEIDRFSTFPAMLKDVVEERL